MVRKKYKEMTYYEKAVAAGAVQIFNADLAMKFAAKPDCEIDVMEAVSEAVLEAADIVDGVLELTRD